MTPLTLGNSYSLNCMLSGFSMSITGTPYLYIYAHYFNLDYYYLEVNFQNVALVSFNFIRVLID
jgi:hypothetical protein